MALVNLKDVKVYNVFSKGFRVVEESKGRDGTDYSTRWTVWLADADVRQDDIVSVSGFLSAKVNEWTDKDQNVRHSVELSLNSPRISTGEGSTGAQGGDNAQNGPTPTQSAPSPQIGAEPWATGPTDEWLPEGSTPF
jgi:hypothetical protein